MTKALVLGSEGNIGAPLVRHLRALDYDVLESDIRPGWRDQFVMADINHPVDLLPAFDWGPDVVFLLSAMVSRVTCEQASGLAIATNLGGINNVLQLSQAGRRQGRVLFDLRGLRPGVRPDGRSRLGAPAEQPLWTVEAARRAARRIRGAYTRSAPSSLRPFMIYDEEEDLGDHRSAMIRFTSELAAGRPIEVHRGSARSWLHVSDAVQAIEAAARLAEYAVINIGHPDVTPIETLAEKIRRELAASPDLVVVRDLPARMTLVKRPLLERQRVLLGVTPRVSLDEGVALVCRRIRGRVQSEPGPAPL